MDEKRIQLTSLIDFLESQGYQSILFHDMIDLIKLQSDRINELEEEVERLGGLEQSVMKALKQVKELDREIIPDYINKGDG